jgi:Txe/YoeB family toxin of Txe-Axe toxin-antitoxin module
MKDYIFYIFKQQISRRRINLLLLLLVTFFTVSCEKVLDVKPDDFPVCLVLNGVVEQDSVVVIHVSRSATLNDIYSIGDLVVTDAEIKLYDGESYIETLQHDSLGLYSSSIRTEKGHIYYITAEKEGYPIARANLDYTEELFFTTNAIKIEKNDSIWQYDIPEPGGEINLWTVKLTFNLLITDKPNVKNYYELNIIAKQNEFSYSHYENDSVVATLGDLLYSDTWISFEDNAINYNDYQRHYGSYSNENFGYHFNAIDDSFFENQSHEFKVRTSYLTSEVKDAILEIKSYPYDLVKYFETLELYGQSYDNPYSEPVNVHSNVENGLGIVCGVNRSDVVIEIQ